ncbi:MAG: nuclear transport factor 2 family protein [Lewinellaceae bacterium]|nr:nuclear transport factor 2 family protein [Lewinellaceae bacterium]
MRSTILLLGLMVGVSTIVGAQEDPQSALFIALQKADSLVFEEGFNRCNLDVLQKVMHPQTEFMHDQNGRQNREQFFVAFTESICGGGPYKPIRRLVPGSMQVFPLKNGGKLYGAIQMGVHHFFIAEAGKEERFTSSGKFIHTWLLEDGVWKLYRVLSYDHQATP